MLKLSFCIPPIYSYSHQCALYGILSAYPETESWRHCNYISVYTLKELYNSGREGTLDFFHNYYGDFRLHDWITNPWLQTLRYSRDLIAQRLNGLVPFIIENIQQGRYLYLVLNRSGYRKRKRDDFHPVLIYAYDEKTRTFSIADNDVTGKYGISELTYHQLKEAVETVTEAEDICSGRPGGILTIALNRYMPDGWEFDGWEYRFNFKKVKKEIREYLFPYHESEIFCYGIDCYRALKSYYSSAFENGEKQIDLRAISSFLDHKTLMQRRLSYLYDNHFIRQDILPQYTQVKNHLLQARGVLMKHNIIGYSSQDKAMHILQYLNMAQEIEAEVLAGVDWME